MWHFFHRWVRQFFFFQITWVQNLSLYYLHSSVLRSLFPDTLFTESVKLIWKLLPHCLIHIMPFFPFPIAGKNSKLLSNTEENISKSWANWFRYHSYEWLIISEMLRHLGFGFFFSEETSAGIALWTNNTVIFPASETLCIFFATCNIV